MIDYKAKPFCLNEEQVRWVEETFDSMTEDEKLGQLFIQMGKPDEYEYLDEKILKKPPVEVLEAVELAKRGGKGA